MWGRLGVQVNKIVLIAIKEDFATTCSLCELIVKAQHTGYSMMIFSSNPWLLERNCSVKTADKLLIPVVYGDHCQNSHALTKRLKCILYFQLQTKQIFMWEFQKSHMISKRWQSIWRNFTFGFSWVQLSHWNDSDEKESSVGRQRR